MVTGVSDRADDVDWLDVQSSGLHDEPSPPQTSQTS